MTDLANPAHPDSTPPESDRMFTVAEIEARQDEVLRRLEELELRILSVLAENGVSVSLPTLGSAAPAALSTTGAVEPIAGSIGKPQTAIDGAVDESRSALAANQTDSPARRARPNRRAKKAA